MEKKYRGPELYYIGETKIYIHPPNDVSESTIRRVLKDYQLAGLNIWNSLPEETKIEMNKKIAARKN